MAGKGNPQVVLRVPAEMKARWEAAAAREDVKLPEFIRRAVERDVASEPRPEPTTEQLAALANAKRVSRRTPPKVRPQDCTARVHAGAYCKRCGSIHVRGI